MIYDYNCTTILTQTRTPPIAFLAAMATRKIIVLRNCLKYTWLASCAPSHSRLYLRLLYLRLEKVGEFLIYKYHEHGPLYMIASSVSSIRHSLLASRSFRS